MEIVIIIAAILVIAFLIYRNTTPKALEFLDANKDGKVDAKDVEVAKQEVKAVVKKTRAAAKTVVAKTATRGRKPKKA